VRVVGFDLGARRVGVAVSDSAGIMASPWGTIVRRGDAEADTDRLVEVVRDVEAEVVVVGLPLSLNGRMGPAGRAARREADALEQRLAAEGIAVETFDERLSTVSAERALRESGRRPARGCAGIDEAAATVILQAWLDRRRARE
jgi:putative Holliday junction resolvase